MRTEYNIHVETSTEPMKLQVPNLAEARARKSWLALLGLQKGITVFFREPDGSLC